MKFFLVVLFACYGVARGTNVCGAPAINMTNFFNKFSIQSPAVAVVGGYFPNATGYWHCKGRFNHSGVHGIFMRYQSHAEVFHIGVSQEVYDPDAYQLYAYRQSQDASGFTLRICKFPNQQLSALTPTTKGRDCIFNGKVNFHFTHDGNRIFGFSWDQDRVSVFLDSVQHFKLPNNWSRVDTWCSVEQSCAFQYVYDISYYMLNLTADGAILHEPCLSSQCFGYSQNVFSTLPGGYIPEDFTYHNWFLLTNSSSLVQGAVTSLQPLIVNCLIAIPKLQGHTRSFNFSEPVSDGCNGATTTRTPDAFRFNINDTTLLASAESILLTTTSGNTVAFVCSNSSSPPVGSTFSLPFGRMLQPYYCFLNISNGANYSLSFLSVLPPHVRELVITKYGGIYINGYAYLHIGLLSAVRIDVQAHQEDVDGFWTIASTSLVDVMVQVNGTAINRVLYCDNPVNSLKCSQLAFDLNDGFYPLALTHAYAAAPPTSFVTLPAFNDHSFLDINITAIYDDTRYPPTLTSSFALVNGEEAFCVKSRQFTLRLFHNVSSTFGSVLKRSNSKCPFNEHSVNDFLSFNRFCVSTKPIAGACNIFFFYFAPGTAGAQVANIYFDAPDGDFLTGTPKALEGVSDVSFLALDVCCKYTIYGFKGEGVIRPTNDSYLAGLYYTSLSGQLLAFKNVTSGSIFSVSPCTFAQQVAFIDGNIVGVMSSVNNNTLFNATLDLPGFFYHTNDTSNCTNPALVYSNIGVCKTGSVGFLPPTYEVNKIQPMYTGNVSVPTNFTMSIRTEYIQLFNTPVSVDCAMYVCNGNQRCNQLLAQYTSACKTIESALQLSARLESMEVNAMLTVSEDAVNLASINQFPGGGYNFSNVLGVSGSSGRSAIEDLLFDKVVTSGLGTVDSDYKACSKGLSIADLACAQYYNGIMVLPGVVDAEKLHMYSASLIGGMVLGGITSAAALPFSYAVQARLNYVALQTDVLQRNQQILAQSFNNAIGNITKAFDSVNDAILQTSQGLNTVAQALSKVQDVVNMQGNALAQLTVQLQNNFQAISSSISDIYGRLDQVTADAQVDRLITGRLASLNAFVAQSLTKYSEVQASRQLAKQKVNECVKSQSNRYGFCGGDGEHIFSITQAAPQGLMFLHTVLVPDSYVDVVAIAGLCINDHVALTLRSSGFILFHSDAYYITSRKMFEPRTPQIVDFVQISSCLLTYVNLTGDSLPDVIPEYVDVNKTLEDFLASIPNSTVPDLPLDIFNATYLNLTGEIADLELRSEALRNTTDELRDLITNINNTLVDLEWLNRVETYIKWPWWVWLIIVIVLIFVGALLVFCCISTGCCGCCGCLGSCLSGCCRCPRIQPYEEVEKVHVQ